MTRRAIDLPKLRVTVPNGERIFTKVELDGKVMPVLRVAFDSGDIRDNPTGLVSVTMTFYASLDLVVDDLAPVVMEVEPVR